MRDADAAAGFEELRFDPDGRGLAARRSGARDGTRVLALHGWLDNSASFEPLARCLPELDFVALDLPGHGHSAHRPPRSWYHYIDYLDDALAALDALGWERCVLLGHSLGGAVASVLAAARPQRVERLVLIEALGPVAARPGHALAALRTAMDERADAAAKRLRVFPDLAEPIAARRQANGLSHAAARLLVERSLRDVGGGYAWRSDPRLKVATPARVHEEQIREWLGGIACPTLLVAADPAPPYFDPATRQARLACLRDAREVVLPGNHHLHLEAPLPVAAAIRDFLALSPR
jgi:pimeloyl-ACP methyl ester carboxylesterase